MRKETITYTDYNGTERTEDYYFNLTKTELTELEAGIDGGMGEALSKIINAQDVPEIMSAFKKIVLAAFGIKSPDGRRIEKSEKISKEFTETPAYDILFQRLFLSGDENAAADFINDIIPKVKDEAVKLSNTNGELSIVKDNIE